jgi:uncharacterized protein YdiU (UPF0061 family)
MKKLAKALDPILPLSETESDLDATYWRIYNLEYESLMSKKFGFSADKEHNFTPEEEACVKEFFKIMQLTGCDFTNTFRDLAKIN